MDTEFDPSEYEVGAQWCAELRMGIKEAKMLYNCIRIYSSMLVETDENTEEIEYMKGLKHKFFAIITEYNLQKQFPDSKFDF